MSGPVVYRAVPAGQSIGDQRRFEFAPNMGAWEWHTPTPGPTWEQVSAATVAARLGPCSTIALPQRRIRVWCPPLSAAEVLGVLRRAGVPDRLVYLAFVENGCSLPDGGAPRLVSGAGSVLCNTIGAQPTTPERHTREQRDTTRAADLDTKNTETRRNDAPGAPGATDQLALI